MRALWRYCLAPLVMAAAVFSAGASAHLGAAAAAHPTVTALTRVCPAGTNWDNLTHTCH